MISSVAPKYTNGKFLELLPEVIDSPEKPISAEISWCFHNFKWIWSLIWKEYQIENFAKLCARYTLKNEKKDTALSNHPNAEEILILELAIATKKVLIDFELPKTQKEFDKVAQDSLNNIYALDIVAASPLKKLNDSYQGDFAPPMLEFLETAHEKFSKEERAKAWKQPLFLYKIISDIVWNDWVKKRIELIIKKPPALPLLTLDLVPKPMMRGTSYHKKNNLLIDVNSNPITSVGREHPLDVPSMELSYLQNYQICHSRAGGNPAKRLCNWIPAYAHRR